MLTCIRPGDLPVVNTRDEAEVYDGSPLDARWDQIDGEPLADLGWIGTDSRGVWVTEPPMDSLVKRAPDLTRIVGEFWDGLRELSPKRYRKTTAREWAALLIMTAAHAREEARVIRARTTKDPDGSAAS